MAEIVKNTGSSNFNLSLRHSTYQLSSVYIDCFHCEVLLRELPGSVLSEDFTTVSILGVLPGSYTMRIGRIREQED